MALLFSENPFYTIIWTRNFDIFAIFLTHVDGQSTGWSDDTGYVLAAPARNYEEGKAVTRRFAKGIWQNWDPSPKDGSDESLDLS